jgi:uncharacterized protein YbbK (DUF523 family)
MSSALSEEKKVDRLRSQRNLFSVLAVCTVVSIGFAVPRKVAAIREFKAVNARLVDLQYAIVGNQILTREVQSQILEVQRQIAKEEGQ